MADHPPTPGRRLLPDRQHGDPLHPAGGGTFGGSRSRRPDGQPAQHVDPCGCHLRRRTLRLYVNGIPVASGAATGAIQTTTNPLWIGGNQPYGEHFKGLIDEARVYNRALSQADIQTDMSTPVVAGGSGTTPPTAPTGLNATAASTTQVNLGWTASTDDVGVTEYRVERCPGTGCTNFAQVGTPTGTTFNDTGRSRRPPTATRCAPRTRSATWARTRRSPPRPLRGPGHDPADGADRA